MLVLSRKLQQEIVIGDNIKVTVLKVKGNTVRLGIEAPRSVRVVRGELPPVEEAPMAEVTVVFDDQPVQSEKRIVSADEVAAREVVPFRSAADPTKESPARKSTDDGVNMSAQSISFSSRLPECLQHNRLKQIVNELTAKKN